MPRSYYCKRCKKNLVSSAELHAAEAGRPLLHHSPTTSQSVSCFAAVHLVLEAVLVLKLALEQVLLVIFTVTSDTMRK